MNNDLPESTPPSGDVNPAAAETGSPEAAPAKRRTRTRKTASELESQAAGEPAASSEVAPAAEAAAPARKPRARKADVAAVSAEDGAAAAASAQDSSPEVALPKPSRSKAAAPVSVQAELVPAQMDAPVAASAEHSAHSAAGEGRAADSGEADAGMAAPGPSDAGSADGGAMEGEGGRGRNRRRGRRGGAAGRADDASEGGAPARAPAPEALGIVVPDAGELFASVISGEFDEAVDEPGTPTEGGAESPLAEEAVADDKRVLAPDPDAPKLHKVLAQSGIGSRRDMEQAIQDGRVKVNGEVAHTGMRISFGDRVSLDDKPVRVRIAPPPPRVIAYHKPVGEVVTHDDPQQRPTVFRRLPRLAQGKWQSVGRLDINTEGLLLFTNSGDLANKLMHPRFGVEREYAVRVLGTLEKDAKAQLLAGVPIEGQQASFKSIEDGGGEGVNHWYRVVITEGRNREVRRLFDAVGLTVSRLIRVRYGCVMLPRGLKRGVCVDLGEQDIKALRLMTGSGPQAPREQRSDSRGDQRQEARGEPRGRQEPRQEQRRDGAARPPQGKRPQGGPNDRPPRDRQERPDRQDADRGQAGKSSRGPRGPRPPQGDELPRDFREPGDPARIPNPLQQTYDRRAILSDRAPRREDDFEDGPIPNPLQQTYDKRFVQGGNAPGFSGPRGMRGSKPTKGGAPREPDPMQTSVGYIGADAFTRKMQGQGQSRGPGRGGKRRGR